MPRTSGLLLVLCSLAPAEVLAARRALSLLSPRAPGALSLGSRANAGCHRGLLLTLPPAGRTLFAQSESAPPLLQSPPLDEPAPVPSEDYSPPPGARATLQAEFAELEANNPDLVGPIVLDVGGVAGLGVGYVFALFGLMANSPALAVAGLAIFVAGIALAVVGTVLTVRAVIARSRRMMRMNAIEEQLRDVQEAPSVPPYPVRHGEPRLEPQLVLARF